VTSIQPELWVDRAAEAVAFYQAAFGAIVLHRVGRGEDIVAQLAIGDAAFWVARAESARQRVHPKAVGGATGRTLLVVDDPDAVFGQAVAAGASPTAHPADEHGWHLARITDPFGHHWESVTPWAPGHHRDRDVDRQPAARVWPAIHYATSSPGSARPW
jgi:PhnB protein